MNENKTKQIEAGMTLTARSACDYDCIFSAHVLERKGSFVTVKAIGNTRRVKVFNNGDVEYIFALGRYSMAPTFCVK